MCHDEMVEGREDEEMMVVSRSDSPSSATASVVAPVAVAAADPGLEKERKTTTTTATFSTITTASIAVERAIAARYATTIGRLLALGRSAREGTLARSLTARRGERIRLVFPSKRPTSLVLCAPGEIGELECDVAALTSSNPSVGPLAILGFLEGWDDVPGEDRLVFLLSPVTTAVYLYDPEPRGGGLYRLGRTVFDFAKKGLVAYDAIYRAPYVDRVVINGDLATVRVLPTTAAAAVSSRVEGLCCGFLRPEGYTLIFGVPDERSDDSDLLSERQAVFCLRERLVVFGHFGPYGCDPGQRVPVYVARGDGEDDEGAVYCFHRTALRLLRLAESLEAFYRLGLKRYFENSRVVANRPGDERFFLVPECFPLPQQSK